MPDSIFIIAASILESFNCNSPSSAITSSPLPSTNKLTENSSTLTLSSVVSQLKIYVSSSKPIIMSEFFSLMRFTIFKEGKETLLLTAQPHKELNNVIHNNLFIFFIPFISDKTLLYKRSVCRLEYEFRNLLHRRFPFIGNWYWYWQHFHTGNISRRFVQMVSWGCSLNCRSGGLHHRHPRKTCPSCGAYSNAVR